MDDMLEPLGNEIEKNLFKAIGRLTTAVVNMPIGYLERRDAEKTAESNARIAITQTITQRLCEELGVTPEQVILTATKYYGQIVKEQLNLNQIVENVNLSLQNTPQENTNTESQIGEIGDDWLNGFRDVACKKSSEEAQDLFSKVLEGEIRKPGSFSLRALTTLSDMDQNVATLFNAFCSLCLVHLDDPRMYHLSQSQSHFKIKDARIPILNGGINDAGTVKPINPSILNKFTDRSEAIYKEYGFNFPEFQLLKEYSLIDDSSLIRYNHFWYNNELRTFTLLTTDIPKSQEDLQKIRISGYALTSVGKELFHITKLDTPPQYIEKITEFLQDYYSIKLYKYPKPQKKSLSKSTDNQQ